MSPHIIRRCIIAVFVLGVAGMIVGSIKDSNGIAITAGLTTAVGALGLILVTSVAPPGSLGRPGGHPEHSEHSTREAPHPTDETVARDVEQRIRALVDAGADEQEVRRLVGRAVDLGRGGDH